METAPLRSFATWARAALIREVAARIAIALAPASPQRVEQPSAVATLEKAVSAAGGWDAGRAAVADKVAYTWFNRIIALRFMDANGYTGIRVVSPERGRQGGQPEVLAEAKRGNIDSTVITNKHTVETVTALLNGTRRSDDPQGEAYALLLAEYCRHWNRSMPFMFEREGDYTELLIPANLLADDSVLARALTVLTEEVCQDVEVIGWLYQFYISERKDDVFAGFKKGEKAGAAEIPAATQLFTPHWIVRYLVENSLGRLWLLNRPASRLAEQMEYYIAPVDEETDYPKVSRPEDVKIIDPACGSGHMLTYAFDLLYAIYEEEGYAPSDIPGLILAKNLYGTEIDPRAGALAAFALTMKARARLRTFFNKKVQPNICVLEPVSFTSGEIGNLVTRDGDRSDEEAFWNQFKHADIFGSLIRPREELIEPLRRHLDAHAPDEGDIIENALHERARRVIFQANYLTCRHHVVVANPPYMGANNMSALLSDWLAESYPLSKSDLMTAFMERAESLSLTLGLWGMINIPSWMFLTSFEQLRRTLLATSSFESLIHLGRGVFGADFGTVAFVVARRPHRHGHKGTYRRLFKQHVEVRSGNVIRDLFLDATYGLYCADQSSFLKIPGTPFAYWLSDAFVAEFEGLPPLVEIGEPRVGLQTSDDARFLRFWFEVDRSRIGLGMRNRSEAAASGRKWFPFNKGGAFRRWYGNIEHVVNWEGDGREIRTAVGKNGKVKARPQNLDYYFKEAVTWSNVSSGAPAFRAVGNGVIFGHVGQSLFGSERVRIALLAILNSSFGSKVLEVLAPTIHYEVGSIAKVPVMPDLDPAHESLVNDLVSLAKLDWDSQETSLDFDAPPWLGRTSSGRLADAVNDEFARWSQLSADIRSMEESLNALVSKAYSLDGEIPSEVQLDRVSLVNNPYFRFESVRDKNDAARMFQRVAIDNLISYAVGCMFGRYSLDKPGLILAKRGDTLQDYLARVPHPSFIPDRDNVIPIVYGDWFEDDIVTRFRRFLRLAFGEQYFEENLRFVTEALGLKDLRDYFVKSFYKDHVQRYKKRPIYWLFSSPKGSFNALIYMHRYTPSTVSTVLNEYLREFKAKLEANRQHHERLAAGAGTPRQQAVAQKEVDRLRKVLLELDEYEHDVLYPLATQQMQIDLDDGVKTNYSKFGAALKTITGLGVSDE
jgi:hypothetical protein